jgi:hypothetical protein
LREGDKMFDRKWIPLLSLSALMLLTFLPATCGKAAKHAKHAVASDPNYKYFKSAYAYTDSGLDTMDVNKLYYCISPDITYRATDGHTYTLDDCKQAVYRIFKILYDHQASITRTTQILNVAYKDNLAIVTTRSRISASISTPLEANPFVANGIFTSEDLWQRSSHGWVMIDTRILSRTIQ